MGKDDNIKWIDIGTKLTKELLKRIDGEKYKNLVMNNNK